MANLKQPVSTLSPEDIKYGGEAFARNPLILKAGSLSMLYEKGTLRHISAGKNEIIRMVYSAVRDSAWLNIPPVISNERIDKSENSFRILYKSSFKAGDINYHASFTIEGNSDNSIIFSMKGEAINSFERNRIGFCILHPTEHYSGEKVSIIHEDGSTENSSFPREIRPHQPFTDIKKMKWRTGGADFEISFYGDLFEAEDQRNWTDASYKTYSTPLSLPYPVTVPKGEKISQKIEIRAEGIKEESENNPGPIIIDTFPLNPVSFPLIGIGQSTRPYPITSGEIEILKKLNFSHYRTDLYLFNHDWKKEASRACYESKMLGFKIEFALFFDNQYDKDAKEFIDWTSVEKPDISVILLFHSTEKTTPEWLSEKIIPELKKALPSIKIGIGTNANFAQINRNPPDSDNNDLICYAIHPQEHASDNLTLVENLIGQKYTIETAHSFTGDKGLWISPVNIQRRFNANRENYEIKCTEEMIPPQVDGRLMSLFGACWAAGSLKYILESGIKGVTFFETVGERGIIQGDFPTRWPGYFPAMQGMIFPLFHVFRFILNNQKCEIIKSKSSDNLKVDSFVLREGNGTKIVLINYTDQLQIVLMSEISMDYKMKQLNFESFPEAVTDVNWYDNTHEINVAPGSEIVLNPFSINFIE